VSSIQKALFPEKKKGPGKDTDNSSQFALESSDTDDIKPTNQRSTPHKDTFQLSSSSESEKMDEVRDIIPSPNFIDNVATAFVCF
jgi:hypothetical protein